MATESRRMIGFEGSTARVLTGLRMLLPGLRSLGAAGIGIGLLYGLWELGAALSGHSLPRPGRTLITLQALLSEPFVDRGPNDKGIGLQLLASLVRVAIGFGLATLVAVPIGVMLGANRFMQAAFDPVVQVLRPVSPLAWFPIGLMLMRSAPNAAVFVVFVCSLWPTVINTAFGVSTVPQSHRDVARVFEFSTMRYLWKVVLPHSLPHIFVGLRLSLGIAWLVIVAAEMLSGGTGIGFFVWDSWNALDLERVLSAILIIGVMGLVLDRAIAFIGNRFAYAEVD
jgi:nitrate/nitrite transport system permease protein